MPVFKDFSENGKLLSTREESLNAENLSRYMEEKGEFAVEGYMDAMSDFLKELDAIFYRRSPTSYGVNTYAFIKRKMIDFFCEKENFSAFVVSCIDKNNTEEPLKPE